MRARRVAVLADVHGTAPALATVLDELERAQPDVIVHCGDLTWGPLPVATVDVLAGRDVLAVRGNADRAVTELGERLRDPSADATARERWMVEQHDASTRSTLASFPTRTHVRYERHVLGRTNFNPGKVGMPYEGAPGADWALLGSSATNRPNGVVIEHRRTAYDLDETERRYHESGDPMTNEMIEILRHPPTPAGVIAHAESLAFSG